MTSQTLRESVAEEIAGISPAIRTKVIAHFAELEVNYHADRTVASETYTKSRLDAIASLDKKIDKLTKAIDQALDGKVEDLEKLLKGIKPDADDGDDD